MRAMDLRILGRRRDIFAADEDETMFKYDSNGRFLARMLAGLTVAMTLVMGSLGYAVYNSQAFL
jgi:hypothetical protein